MAIVYAYYLHKKQLNDKLLYIDEIDPVCLASASNEDDGPIKIEYNGKTVAGVWRSRVLFWNRGYRALEASDFLIASKITCGPKGQLLDCQMESVDVATTVSLEFTASNGTAELKIGMLRPGEGFVIYADKDDKESRPNFEIHTKNADSVQSPRLIFILFRNILDFVLHALVFLGGIIAFALLYWRLLGYFGIEEIPQWVSGAITISAFVFGFILWGATKKATRLIWNRGLSPTVVGFYKRKDSL